ncbi:bifunctional UDP-sugar hydrolase/5'-nucleotidase [Microbacterium sp. 2FI]|uniref:bifunctional metallophosphatase/5'-nucleotidase n=1 Tax=Microbacterium sp. 2FI TaxID=2502193 RepID=UPI001BB1059E|nr:bifunctional UDP-sugar hydrolase/5'-nucleotidase [Microbacterium sp. 2FI]
MQLPTPGATSTTASARTRRRVAAGALAGAATLALALGAVVPAQAAPPSAPPGNAFGRMIDINLVTVNDFHGRIEQSGAIAGIARLSGAVNALRAENPNTIFAAAGDMIGASTFTSFIQDDVPTIDALNAAGLDVSSVGNHEFDRGFADLTDRVIPLADWEYLGANVYHKGTEDPALPEYWITEVREKKKAVRIGFVGAVTDELPSLVSPGGIEDISVGSPVEAANRVAGELSDGDEGNGEADIIVLLVHEGAATTDIASATDASTRFGQIVLNADDDIDAIVSGHTHLAYNHVIDGRPVISSGQYGERFSNMEISWDTKSEKITAMENTVYTMATAFDASGNVTAYLAEPDPVLVPIVTEATNVAKVLGSVELGSAAANFGRAIFKTPVAGESFPENRGGESTLGNFVADVQKWSLNADQDRGVQIAFMNPGGLRADLASGEVTYAEAAAVQPFANTLVSMTLTGAQIKSVLEEQWQPAGASRPFLKLGVSAGFTYTYDPLGAPGARITQMWLDGVAIDPAAPYVVGVNSFLSTGGDNFTTFRSGTGKADSGKVDLESMVDWFDAFGTAAIDLGQRAVGVNVAGGTTVAAGSTVLVNMSSLDFTRDEPDALNVLVTSGGATVGSAPVDTDFTPTTDEVGTAAVSVAIPAGASGPTTFQVSVAPTGTTTSFTLNVTAP